MTIPHRYTRKKCEGVRLIRLFLKILFEGSWDLIILTLTLSTRSRSLCETRGIEKTYMGGHPGMQSVVGLGRSFFGFEVAKRCFVAIEVQNKNCPVRNRLASLHHVKSGPQSQLSKVLKPDGF